MRRRRRRWARCHRRQKDRSGRGLPPRQQTRGSVGASRAPQWGPGQSPERKRIWSIFQYDRTLQDEINNIFIAQSGNCCYCCPKIKWLNVKKTSASVELTQTRYSHSTQLFRARFHGVSTGGTGTVKKVRIRCLYGYFQRLLRCVKSANGQKFEFLGPPCRTAWPTWMALCQNVRRSVSYIRDRT